MRAPEWLRSIGFEQQKMADETGVRFVISRVECDFLKPARLDDELEVDVRVTRAGSASMVFAQTASRGAEVLATARVRVGCIDVEGFIPARLPEDFRSALTQIL